MSLIPGKCFTLIDFNNNRKIFLVLILLGPVLTVLYELTQSKNPVTIIKILQIRTLRWRSNLPKVTKLVGGTASYNQASDTLGPDHRAAVLLTNDRKF